MASHKLLCTAVSSSGLCFSFQISSWCICFDEAPTLGLALPCPPRTSPFPREASVPQEKSAAGPLQPHPHPHSTAGRILPEAGTSAPDPSDPTPRLPCREPRLPIHNPHNRLGHSRTARDLLRTQLGVVELFQSMCIYQAHRMARESWNKRRKR
jgi:hypothetical protein